MKELDFIPNIIRDTDLEDIPDDPELTEHILNIMTPPEILLGREFIKPGIINPQIYPDFHSLMTDREKVRNLELLPVKTEEEYVRYHQQVPADLEKQVKDILGSSKIALASNLFPYWLPEDLEQSLVWVADPSTKRNEIAGFIAKVMSVLKINMEQVILFERPVNIETKLVRGTFAAVRHIHFWHLSSDKKDSIGDISAGADLISTGV